MLRRPRGLQNVRRLEVLALHSVHDAHPNSLPEVVLAMRSKVNFWSLRLIITERYVLDAVARAVELIEFRSCAEEPGWELTLTRTC